MRKWTVRDVMTEDVVAVPEDASYRAIVDLLAERRISAVPVVDPAGKVVGVVSEADLLHRVEFADSAGQRRLFPQRRRSPREKSAGRTARELMSSPVVTAGPDTGLHAAARLMAEKGVKRLPVVADDGSLVGIVSRADVLKVHLRPDAEVWRDIVDEVLRRTLWLDPSEVQVEVDGGLVALSGHLDRRSLAELTVRLVGAVPGVIAVRDHLTYDLDDAELARSRWSRSHPFSATGPSI